MDAILTAELDRLLRGRAVFSYAVHPHPSEARLYAVLYNPLCHVGRGHQKGGFYPGRDIAHAGETAVAVELLGLRIDRDHFIASFV
jgi:hypothetical protein